MRRHTKTPLGHGLGRIPDRADPRDLRYSAIHHGEAARAKSAQIPPRVDLSAQLPPCVDQGDEGCCGACAGGALMAFLQTKAGKAPLETYYSRQMLYWLVRHEYEHTGNDDAGVETRDVLKAMQYFGCVPEKDWPFDKAHFALAPTTMVMGSAKNAVLAMYTRLVQDTSYLGCLAAGYPFELGIEVFESIDSDDLARSGVMPMPAGGEEIIGGHDILVVGYDMAFKSSAAFKASGVDPARVSDTALLIRNSWGTDWGINGHFWMPLPYATNPSTGGDAWTGRLT